MSKILHELEAVLNGLICPRVSIKDLKKIHHAERTSLLMSMPSLLPTELLVSDVEAAWRIA